MKVVKVYKGFKIKLLTKNERRFIPYLYQIYNLEGEVEWGADTISEACEWIDSY